VGGGEQNQILTAGLATISGGQSNLVTGSDYANIGGGTVNLISGGSYATISGGQNNAISAGPPYNADYSTIGGGGGNFIDAGVDPVDFATIAGGESNRIGHFSYYATVGGGAQNEIAANAQGSTIAGGVGNLAGAFVATISGGQSNLVTFSDGTVPGGLQAMARLFGQMAYASGAFANAGDAQTSVYVCRNVTSDATQTELFLDGVSQRMKVALNSTWAFDILLTGRASGGNSAAFTIRGVIKNNSGTTTLVGSITKTILAADVPAWDATVTADNVNSALSVRVTGAAATSIRWAASVRTTEVGY
jgi:hypothetical protein